MRNRLRKLVYFGAEAFSTLSGNNMGTVVSKHFQYLKTQKQTNPLAERLFNTCSFKCDFSFVAQNPCEINLMSSLWITCAVFLGMFNAVTGLHIWLSIKPIYHDENKHVSVDHRYIPYGPWFQSGFMARVAAM